MGTQQNKERMLRFIEGYQNGGDEAVLQDTIADDFVDHTNFPGLPAGRPGVKAIFDMFRSAFPDFHSEVLDQAAEGDKVWTYKTFSGTQRGELMGIPPTGREVAWTLIDIVRIRDGQIVEHWNVVDLMGLMQQLGAVAS
jgi:predicted ester cyclase